jgi:hypothetical protein
MRKFKAEESETVEISNIQFNRFHPKNLNFHETQQIISNARHSKEFATGVVNSW